MFRSQRLEFTVIQRRFQIQLIFGAGTTAQQDQQLQQEACDKQADQNQVSGRHIGTW